MLLTTVTEWNQLQLKVAAIKLSGDFMSKVLEQQP